MTQSRIGQPRSQFTMKIPFPASATGPPEVQTDSKNDINRHLIKMIIFKDAIGESNDELFSDTYPMELIDGVVYKVKGKQVQYKEGVDDALIGGNASAEGGDEGTDEAVVSGINVVLAARLVETAFAKKKDYQIYIKKYMKDVKERLEKENPGEVDVFTKGIAPFIKKVLENFKEYQFFLGEHMNADGMTVLVEWEGETPYVYFFKHGLEEEKV